MFEHVKKFENDIVCFITLHLLCATDCCTHAIELCLRLKNFNNITIPNHTYISVPFTMEKLNLDWKFEHEEWEDFYHIKNTNIIDAAVYWKKNGYIKNTLCV